MKYFKYLFVFIFALFVGVITVSACSVSDGCSNCYPEAQAVSCKSALDSAVKQKVKDNCAGMTGTAYEQCKSGTTDSMKGGSNSGKNNNQTPNNGGGSNNGGGGSNANLTDMTDEAICQLCNGYNSDSKSTPTEEMKAKCSELGCPINENSQSGVIQGDTTDYKDVKTDNNLTGCEKVFGLYKDGKFTNRNSLGYFLQLTFNIIKYVVPIILIVLTSIDFLKGIAASDKEIIKVATGKLTKRAIVALAIFLIPTILNLILGLVTTYGTCGIK